MHLGQAKGLAFAAATLTTEGFLVNPSTSALGKKPLNHRLEPADFSLPRLPVSASDAKLFRTSQSGKRSQIISLRYRDDASDIECSDKPLFSSDASESQSVDHDSSTDLGGDQQETDRCEDTGAEGVAASDVELRPDEGESKYHLFGLDELGNKVRSMLKRASHGGEIKYEIDDELHDCYPQCRLDDMKYTIQHDDMSGQMLLIINSEFEDRDNSFYHKLMRDSVFAEWQGISKEGEQEDLANESLHVKMHITANKEGPGPLWEEWLKQSKLPKPVVHELIHIGGELRSKIFHDHKEDALEAIFHVIKDLLHDNPKLLSAPIYIHYLSDLEELKEVEALGPIGEWFDKIQHRHDHGFQVSPSELISKNLKVWSESMQHLKKVMEDVCGRVIPKLIAEHAQVVGDQAYQSYLIETLVLLMLLANDNIQK